jgi:hypothetical protein
MGLAVRVQANVRADFPFRFELGLRLRVTNVHKSKHAAEVHVPFGNVATLLQQAHKVLENRSRFSTQVLRELRTTGRDGRAVVLTRSRFRALQLVKRWIFERSAHGFGGLGVFRKYAFGCCCTGAASGCGAAGWGGAGSGCAARFATRAASAFATFCRALNCLAKLRDCPPLRPASRVSISVSSKALE